MTDYELINDAIGEIETSEDNRYKHLLPALKKAMEIIFEKLRENGS